MSNASWMRSQLEQLSTLFSMKASQLRQIESQLDLLAGVLEGNSWFVSPEHHVFSEIDDAVASVKSIQSILSTWSAGIESDLEHI